MSDSSTAQPMTVMLVDDTEDLRELLRITLERSGCFRVVAEAGDGRQALETMPDAHPDLVLLDIAMPVMDGLEALPLLRTMCPESVVVMFSGFMAAEMADRAMAAGAAGYLQKGQSPSALVAELRRLVGRATSAA